MVLGGVRRWCRGPVGRSRCVGRPLLPSIVDNARVCRSYSTDAATCTGQWRVDAVGDSRGRGSDHGRAGGSLPDPAPCAARITKESWSAPTVEGCQQADQDRGRRSGGRPSAAVVVRLGPVRGISGRRCGVVIDRLRPPDDRRVGSTHLSGARSLVGGRSAHDGARCRSLPPPRERVVDGARSDRNRWDHWSAGPSSSSLLVRATSLAAYWPRRNR